MFPLIFLSKCYDFQSLQSEGCLHSESVSEDWKESEKQRSKSQIIDFRNHNMLQGINFLVVGLPGAHKIAPYRWFQSPAFLLKSFLIIRWSMYHKLAKAVGSWNLFSEMYLNRNVSSDQPSNANIIV